MNAMPTSVYSAGRLPGVDLDLRDNVNLWGGPPHALAALRAARDEDLLVYPSPGGGELVDALASTLGVRGEEIVAGCGSDGVIDAFLRAVTSPGDTIAFAAPTFSMIPVFARLNGLVPMPVPLRADGAADIDALLATRARVIYVCSPNNPTGTVTSSTDIRRLVSHAPGVVLVDEAYAEFANGHDWRSEAPAMERVLITRTFSKAWGLAGLRVGYGVGGRELVAATARAQGPYTVNALAERCAVTALREDEPWMLRTAAEACASRDRLAAALRRIDGARVWESRGNFVFLEVGALAPALERTLRSHRIGVRVFERMEGVDTALRIGVAPWPRLVRVLDATRAFLCAEAAECA